MLSFLNTSETPYLKRYPMNKAMPKLMWLNWLQEEAAFVIHFSPLFLENLIAHFKNPGRLAQDFLTRHPGFVFDSEKLDSAIGMHECLQPLGIQFPDGRKSFIFKIPILKIITDEPCPQCKGSKINPFNHGSCNDCRETGKRFDPDEAAQKKFQGFGLSMYFFSKLAYLFHMEYANIENKKTYEARDLPDQQVMLFQISENTGYANAHMFGWLHDAIIEEVIKFNPVEQRAVAMAMESVEEKLYQQKNGTMSQFRLTSNDDKFWLQVPGSACTLGVEGPQIGNCWEWGKILTSHNVDHRTAQICFLAGLATLTDIALSKKRQLVSQ